MTTVFVKLYGYFSRHKAWMWASMLVLFVCCGYLASQIYLEEDIAKLMPSAKDENGETRLAFSNLRIKDKTFLLFDGNDPEELAEVCDSFIEQLMERDSVTHAIGDIFYNLPEELIPDAASYLLDHAPAYIDTDSYAKLDSLLTLENMQRQMADNREALLSELGQMMPELILSDPVGIRLLLQEQVSPLLQGGTSGYQIIDNHFFVPDSTVCVAFITPRFSATDTGQGSALFRMMNQLIEEYKPLHPGVTISYHGTPASGFYNSTQIKEDLTTTILGALVLVLIFLLFCFKSWKTIPLLLLPVAFGTLFGLALMYVLKGQFSLLALGIGGVVLGVALSYVLHVLTHRVYVDDPEQVIRDQAKPVMLGCFTTIGSFAGLLFIQTDILRDFGLFAAFAILGTTLFSLVYLPHLMGKPSINQQAFKAIDKLNAWPFDKSKTLIAVILAVVTVSIGIYALQGTHFDADMHNLGYEAQLTEYSENLLRDKTYTGEKQKYFASKGSTMEEAIANFTLLDHKLDSLQQLGLVKSYTHTNQLFITLEEQQRRIDAWQAYWTPEKLEQVRSLIAKAAPQAGMKAEAFEPFFELATADYEPETLYEAGLVPEGYLSTLMEESYGGDFLCFTTVRCANDSVRGSDTDYIRICDAVAAVPELLVLDTYYYTTGTLIQMSEDFNVLQWLSMAFVFVVLLLSFRFKLSYAVLGFMPILLSWMMTLGLMDLFGSSFNLISIIISTFIFGIGVDYSIFVMNGLTASDQRMLGYHKTAIFFSAVTLIVTVSSMLIATHPAIRSVGFSTLAGLLSAVILSYVLQPAVFRWMRQKLGRKEQA